MSKVKSKRLGDLITLKRGYDLPENRRIPGSYPVISSAGISGYHNEYKVDGQGVVTGRYGTLGQMYFIDGKYWPHNTALYVRDFKGNDPKYVYYLLSCLGRIRTSDKSAVPGVNRNELHEMFVPVIEDKATQVVIRKNLESIDTKIELNNRINAELEAMAKTLYDYWFVQFDFPFDFEKGKFDANGKPYKTSGGKMVYDPILKREIPEGWEICSLWNIAKYFNGLAMQKYRPTGEEYLPVIKIREMNEGFTESTEKARTDLPIEAIVNDGDVLFSWSATLDVKIWSQGRGALNQHIFKVTSDKYPKTFYYFELLNYLKHFKMMAELRKTTMGHITLDHLKQAKICLPPLEFLEYIDRFIEPIFNKNLMLEKENRTLSALRDWLLPMLMNGQVTVR
ncbi:MAG: restriction endonuclease subunit S [Burkholderiales bacterium]|nr:restriction endonuclease subunit S [Nitrosomonas sp.]MCP5274844.1 restriction endonuclease subunit S [Burkholderiales bacterium]